MSQIAIKGHATRGREVIELLEMLGGENKYHINITEENLLYTIRKDDNVIIATYPNSSINKIFTLEEFIEKYPYKVGDKVVYQLYGIILKIKTMFWNIEKEQVFYRLDCNKLFVASVDELKPYKEETMKEKIESFEILEDHCTNEVKIEFDPSKFEMVKRENDYYVVRKKPQYPKTYDECCKVLFPNTIELGKVSAHGYKGELLTKFGELLICRTAYWKIVGEEMGLGKSWEPTTGSVYCISRNNNIIECSYRGGKSNILEFPTEEMRDAFYENFLELIIQCKELL